VPSYKIAHHQTREGVNLIIVPMDSHFGNLVRSDQDAIVNGIQMAARSTDPPLAGKVVPVWESPSGGIGFLAPREYFPFFESISMEWVWMNINRELSW